MARAGLTHLPAHINVQGVTPAVLRRSGNGDHKVKVDAMVFVRLGYQNTVIPLATSQMNDGRAAWYEDSSHKKHYGLTTEELVTVLETVVIPRHMHAAGRTCYLILDRHPAHKSKGLKMFFATQQMELILLPPNSPDLSPLDCNLFGVVKNKHSKRWPGATGNWNDRASLLLELLHSQDAEPHIKSWKSRLEQVVQKQGSRVDRD